MSKKIVMIVFVCMSSVMRVNAMDAAATTAIIYKQLEEEKNSEQLIKRKTSSLVGNKSDIQKIRPEQKPIILKQENIKAKL